MPLTLPRGRKQAPREGRAPVRRSKSAPPRIAADSSSKPTNTFAHNRNEPAPVTEESLVRRERGPAKTARKPTRSVAKERIRPTQKSTERRNKPARHSPWGNFKPDRPIPAAPSSAPDVPEDGKVRISKLMSERGMCSRREADEYIAKGWVYVNGEKVEELGTRADPDAEITLDKRSAAVIKATILLNKPVGYVSGQAEDGYRPAIALILPENHYADDNSKLRFVRQHLRGLAPAGRLDIDSTGLLVLTQDGRIAKKLIGQDSSIEKEYLVRVEGNLSEDGMKQLNHGLSLDGKPLKPAKVSWMNDDQLRFVLREGKKRQIRRMCELVGLNVIGLKRVRIGSVKLGKLPVGRWRYLGENETF